MLYRIIDNKAVGWNGEPINGISHPLSIETHWTDVSLNQIGLYRLVSAGATPSGKIHTGTTIEIVNGVPTEVATYRDESPSDYSLTARQLRLGLVRNNVSLSLVQSTINSISDSKLRDEAQIYWDFSTVILWDHPMTQTLLQMSGITENNAIQMWLTAKGYEQ